jgi:hypothetical protein
MCILIIYASRTKVRDRKPWSSILIRAFALLSLLLFFFEMMVPYEEVIAL